MMNLKRRKLYPTIVGSHVIAIRYIYQEPMLTKSIAKSRRVVKNKDYGIYREARGDWYVHTDYTYNSKGILTDVTKAV